MSTLFFYPPPNAAEPWAPKQIANTKVPTKIGRDCGDNVPAAHNGFFPSNTMSRAHAEVWAEDGKVYIKDTKSFNGTYVNGKRLSPEREESGPFELKNDDTIEFGIDVFDDEKKNILHPKITARVVVGHA